MSANGQQHALVRAVRLPADAAGRHAGYDFDDARDDVAVPGAIDEGGLALDARSDEPGRLVCSDDALAGPEHRVDRLAETRPRSRERFGCAIDPPLHVC